MMDANEVLMARQAEWIERARAGDELAFSNLVALHQRQVYNLCYRMLGGPQDAEDAAQETFLRAFKAMDRYKSEHKFITWLLSIASHYCIDQLRRRRFWTVSLDNDPQPQLPDRRPTPEQVLSSREQEEQVRTLLGHLSATDRAAVVLYYWYDHSYAEIAETLSLTVSAVKSRLHRARRLMAKNWAAAPSSTRLEKRQPHESPAL
jgi:RNA polymerase sigma-70 factor (ECF subfamily)